MLRKIAVFCMMILLGLLVQAQKPESKYLMHKVVAGESLYKIGKKYQVTVEELLKNNPGVTAGNLKPGMILRVSAKKPQQKPAVNSAPETKKQVNHIVIAKETLYSISKKYGVTVEQLKTWNDLGEAPLKTGMVLIIYPAAGSTDKTQSTPPVKSDTAVSTLKKPTVPAAVKPEIPIRDELPGDAQPEENLSLTTLSKKFLAQQKSGTPQSQKGTAAPMATTAPGNATTYFAMHKTAPVGTILKIKNLENGKVTYAKVIGQLPDLDENKFVMVRVSMGVSKVLQMGYGKAYVEMTYAH